MSCNGCGKRATKVLKAIGYQEKGQNMVSPKGKVVPNKEVQEHHARVTAQALLELLKKS